MAELRNINWKKLVKDTFFSSYGSEIIKKSKSLQWALTYALRQQNHIVFGGDEVLDLIIDYKGIKFKPHLLNYPRMIESYDRYKVEDLKEDDIVLDLGANIGSFTLPAAQVCKRVIAVEPMFWTQLRQNIKLNSLTNIIVIPESINTYEVDCQEYTTWNPQNIEIQKLISEYQPTYLRMDIGGAEWKEKDIKWISKLRHLELELHFWTKEQQEKGLGELGWNKFWKNSLEFYKFGYIARWSKHKHWLYISADKNWRIQEEVNLTNGNFTGQSKRLWRLGPIKSST